MSSQLQCFRKCRVIFQLMKTIRRAQQQQQQPTARQSWHFSLIKILYNIHTYIYIEITQIKEKKTSYIILKTSYIILQTSYIILRLYSCTSDLRILLLLTIAPAETDIFNYLKKKKKKYCKSTLEPTRHTDRMKQRLTCGRL